MSIKNLKFFLKFADFFIFFAFCGIIFIFFGSFFRGGNKKILQISTPTENFEYPLGENNHIFIDGAIGKTEIIIQDSKVYIKDSVCPNKLCVHQGAISKSGQWLSCAPNKIFIMIKNEKNTYTNSETDSQIDAVSY